MVFLLNFFISLLEPSYKLYRNKFNKKMTEYLYEKENPKSPLRYKSQGWESFYRGMPNHFERAELIGR